MAHHLLHDMSGETVSRSTGGSNISHIVEEHGEELEEVDMRQPEDDSDIDFILTFEDSEGKDGCECCGLPCRSKCMNSQEESSCVKCFKTTFLRHSPGSILGVCWGCACKPCLLDLPLPDKQDGVNQKDFLNNIVEHRQRWRDEKLDEWLKGMEKYGLMSKKDEHYNNIRKVCGTPEGLLREAEKKLLQMPFKPFPKDEDYEVKNVFSRMRKPLKPAVPTHLKLDPYYRVPFKVNLKTKFYIRDEKTGGYSKDWNTGDAGRKFFTSAQRSAIVYSILEENGLDDHLTKGYATSAFPLHEGPYKLEKGQKQTDRSFLYENWAHPRNWYKIQPHDHIRKYFGETVGIYFALLGFYTSWLIPAAIAGLAVFLYSLSLIFNPISDDICNEDFRYDFYMCPPCDGRCDFWYLKSSCRYSRLVLIFDNLGTIFFAIFMSVWAASFVEFWKRQQYLIQFRWGMIGYEELVEKPRPQFEYRIKQFEAKCEEDAARQGEGEESCSKFDKYISFKQRGADGKESLIQPALWYWPKIVIGFVVLGTMIVVVIAIVVAVIIYRLAIAAAIYILVSSYPQGPSVGAFTVSVTATIIRLIAILIMSKLYTYLAYKLTNWELHRTQTDYKNSFTTKMYTFEFFNVYSSLFYIAFFKGNLSGYPGNYGRFSGLRAEECADYGCMLELTIELFILMVGKQTLSNATEFFSPMLPRLWSNFKSLVKCKFNWKLIKAKGTTRYEQDKDLQSLDEHVLFFEYLELMINYGLLTIFVVVLPLAPLIALINNLIEIRLDAYKFVVYRKRPVARRAGDIGAWYDILYAISKLAVVINGFLIALNSGYISQLVFTYTERSPNSSATLSGYVNWSLSPFTVDRLLDGRSFPAFTAHELPLYDVEGSILPNLSDNALYLPYVDTNCMISRFPEIRDHLVQFNDTRLIGNSTEPYLTFLSSTYKSLFVRGDRVNETWRDLILRVKDTSRSPEGLDSIGECFLPNTQCRFRGFEDDDVDNRFGGTKYLQVQLARLAFVVFFEHLVFATSFLFVWMISDVPKNVKEHIKREKLLSYEAELSQNEEASPD